MVNVVTKCSRSESKRCSSGGSKVCLLVDAPVMVGAAHGMRSLVMKGFPCFAPKAPYACSEDIKRVKVVECDSSIDACEVNKMLYGRPFTTVPFMRPYRV